MPLKPKDFEGPFTKPLKKKRFRKEAKAALRLAYGKAERGLNKEIKASRMQQKRLGDWFGNYDQSIAQAGQRTAGAYSQANQSIQQNSSSAANYAEALRQRMAGEAQQDAARRGVAYDPSGSYTAADANLSRINSANTLSAVTGAQGASQAAYLSDKQRIGEREKIEQKLNEQARRRSLQQEKRDLAGDKAAQIADMLAGARDSERDFYLGLKASQDKGEYYDFAKDQQKFGARQDRLSAKRQRKLAKLQNRHEKADDKRGQKWQDQGADKGDAGKPGNKSGRRRAMAYLKQAKRGAYGSRREAIDYLINRGVDARVAKFVVKRAANKGGGGEPWGGLPF